MRAVEVEEALNPLVVMQATVDELHVERSCARVEVLELVHPLDRDRVKECRDCSGCRDSKPKWDISASAIEQGPVIPRLEVARREVKRRIEVSGNRRLNLVRRQRLA